MRDQTPRPPIWRSSADLNACPTRRSAPARLPSSAGLLLALAIAFSFLAFASSALALKFEPAGQIDGSATPNETFYELRAGSVAVNGFNGHVLVADSGVALVYEYDASHNFLGTWDGSNTPAGSFVGEGVEGTFGAKVGVAADDSTGDVYVLDSTHGVVDKFDSSGALIASFGDTTPAPDGQLAGLATPDGSFGVIRAGGDFYGPLGIAVDQATHDLYVIDNGHEFVDVFDSSGAYLRQLDRPSGYTNAGDYFYGIQDLAVNNANDHVYLSMSNNPSSSIFELDPLGPFLDTWNGSSTPAASFDFRDMSVAADNGSGRVYIGDPGHEVLDVFDSSGAYLRQLTELGGASGVAVAQASGDLYVADNSNEVIRVFNAQEVSEPEVAKEFASTVLSSSANLNASVNPSGAETTYHFEYGTDASYGSAVPIPGQGIGAGNNEVAVSQHLTGLQPDTTYHYRILATNSIDTTVGADHLFRTRDAPSPPGSFPGQGFLPQNRAWEMVSPPDKNGADVMADAMKVTAAVDGSAVAFTSLVGFAGPVGGSYAPDYLSVRDPRAGANGWSTHSLVPPNQEPQPFSYSYPATQTTYTWFNSDLTKGVVRTFSPLTEAPNVAAARNLYLRSDLRNPGTGAYRLLTDSFAPQPATGSDYSPIVAGASADLQHIIFESKLSLTADAPSCANPDVTKCPEKLYEWVSGPGAGTVRLVGKVPSAPETECQGTACTVAPRSVAGQAASDLRYTAQAISADGSRIFFRTPNIFNFSSLYARVDGDRTIKLNASERAGYESPFAAKFLYATPDGSQVFFQDSDSLTEAGGSGLYRYDFNAPAGSRLTALGIGDLGVIGSSEDGNTVYSVDAGSGVALWRQGSGARAIGNLGEGGAGAASLDNAGAETISLHPKKGRVSPDGRYLLFTSDSGKGLTGYDHGACEINSGKCAELYLYDAEANGGAGQLVCASCNYGALKATSSANDMSRFQTGATRIRQYLNHPLSNDGKVFFDTGEALSAEDTNGKRDVYEYDPSTDRQYLLSSGQGDADSYFMDATPDGSSVFFVTRQRLSNWDFDNSYDLYDARVGGGLPEPSPVPASCQGDACQPPPAALNDPTPASSSFAGAGNPAKKKHHKKRHHKKRVHHKRAQKRTANNHRGGAK